MHSEVYAQRICSPKTEINQTQSTIKRVSKADHSSSHKTRSQMQRPENSQAPSAFYGAKRRQDSILRAPYNGSPRGHYQMRAFFGDKPATSWSVGRASIGCRVRAKLVTRVLRTRARMCQVPKPSHFASHFSTRADIHALTLYVSPAGLHCMATKIGEQMYGCEAPVLL